MAAKVKLQVVMEAFANMAALVNTLLDTRADDAATIDGLRAELADSAAKLTEAAAEDAESAAIADNLQTQIQELADKAAAATPAPVV